MCRDFRCFFGVKSCFLFGVKPTINYYLSKVEEMGEDHSLAASTSITRSVEVLST
jgi:hypothetical protein